MTADKPRLRAIGYIRVSSVGGRSGPEYHTLDIQLASIKRVCEQRGYELVDVLTDENRSGKSRKRPEFGRALDRVLGGEADAIAVWKVSRFSRNWAEAAADTELLLDAGKDLISGEEGFDTTTTGGRALLRMLFVLAAWELEVLNEGWENLKRKVVDERGAVLGKPGLGYRHIKKGGGRIEPDPKTAPIVQELFQRRADGEGLGSLAKWLDEVLPRPNSLWDLRSIRRLLATRRYLGEAHWRDVIFEGAHEPLVHAELWHRAQGPKDTDLIIGQRSPARIFPLSGLLRCASCDGPMSGSNAKDRQGVPRPGYLCSRRAKGCDAPVSISAVQVEDHLMALTDALMAEVARRGEFVVVAGESPLAAQMEDVRARIEEAHTFEGRRVLGKDWLATVGRLNAERDQLDAQMAEERRRSGVPDRALRWAELDEPERWLTLRDAVERVVVGPAVGRGRNSRPLERLTIFWRMGQEADLGLQLA